MGKICSRSTGKRGRGDDRLEDAASVHVLKRVGFKQEGVLKKRYNYQEGFHDELFFGILASD